MYIPQAAPEVPFSNFQVEVAPELELELPNITKPISDVLQVCESAGLDQHGLGCGLSVL